MKYKAVIFDLDGVIVTTDNCHYLAWKKMADEQNIFFDREINERLRGVSRMESLNIILERADKKYSEIEKEKMATKKNSYYVDIIKTLNKSAVLPGAIEFCNELINNNIKIAIGSSSKNAGIILKQVELDKLFEAIADGNDIKNSKPDPEVFLLASKKLGISPKYCLVVEDAVAGVEAAKLAGMDVVALGAASLNKNATYNFEGLFSITNGDKSIFKEIMGF